MKGFMPDRIGRFYAYCRWAGRKSGRESFAKVPLPFLKMASGGLHDLDLNLAVAKVTAHPAEIMGT